MVGAELPHYRASPPAQGHPPSPQQDIPSSLPCGIGVRREQRAPQGRWGAVLLAGCPLGLRGRGQPGAEPAPGGCVPPWGHSPPRPPCWAWGRAHPGRNLGALGLCVPGTR